jgi:molybdopterin-containing oxidoreductase family membrane subunit
MINQEAKARKIIEIINGKTKLRYKAVILVSILLTLFGIWGCIVTLSHGLSLWGINNKVSWGIAVANFIFWIGIAHSGTFISAILFLLNQKWRTEFNRMAELMTLIAIMIAGFFPLIHTGRPWYSAYWLLPYYNNMSLLPNFNSPLTWDIIAIMTYFSISVIFFFIGIFPDLYSIRTEITNSNRKSWYTLFTKFWYPDKLNWQRYWILYLILSGIATPLVISVHSIVSYDFAVTLNTSWHTTLLPPYFVIGALYSGLAMIMLIYVLYNKLTGLRSDSSALDKLNKTILFLSISIGFVYIIELLTGSFDNMWKTDIFLGINGGFLVYFMWISNALLPLTLLNRRIRSSVLSSVIVSVFIIIGMWLERFLLVVNGLNVSRLTNEITTYSPTLVDMALLSGSFGLFIMLILLVGKTIPMFTLFERDGK